MILPFAYTNLFNQLYLIFMLNAIAFLNFFNKSIKFDILRLQKSAICGILIAEILGAVI